MKSFNSYIDFVIEFKQSDDDQLKKRLFDKFSDVVELVKNFVNDRNNELKKVKDRPIDIDNIQELVEVLNHEKRIKRTKEKLWTLSES